MRNGATFAYNYENKPDRNFNSFARTLPLVMLFSLYDEIVA